MQKNITRETSEAKESWSCASEAKEHRSTLAEAEENKLKLDSRVKITESGLASRWALDPDDLNETCCCCSWNPISGIVYM